MSMLLLAIGSNVVSIRTEKETGF